jgi:hypothetical protein
MLKRELSPIKKKYIILGAVAVIGMGSSVLAGSRSADGKKAESAGAAQAQLESGAKITSRSSATNETIDIAFPYHRPGVDKEKLDINFRINYAGGQKALFHITPDDCVDMLEINGKEIELTGEALAQRCNWTQGFTMDLRPYLNKGSNKVHFLVRNISGWVGLNVAPATASAAAASATAPAEKK